MSEGVVWVDGRRDSERLYRSTVTSLSTQYQTSQAVIRFRLEELGVVRRSQIGRRVQHIGKFLV